MDDAQNFVNIIRGLIKDELSTHSYDRLCMVAGKINDDTYNIFVLPDTNNPIQVRNESRHDFKTGDIVRIYVPNAKLAEAFIFAKA